MPVPLSVYVIIFGFFLLQCHKEAVRANRGSWMPWDFELQPAHLEKNKPDKAAA